MKLRDMENLKKSIGMRGTMKKGITTFEFIFYLLVDLCLPKSCKKDKKNSHNKFNTFQNGNKMLNHELDVVHILGNLRKLKVYYKASLTQPQRVLMKFQREQVVSSDAVDSNADFSHEDDLIKELCDT